MKKCIISAFLIAALLLQFQASAQGTTTPPSPDKNRPISRVEPPFWWVGMKNPVVELMLHEKGIAEYSVRSGDERVKIVAQDNGDSPNYKFVQLDVSAAKAGKIPLLFEKNGKEFRFEYELRERQIDPDQMQGLSPSDVIYLIFPDRFTDGDPNNNQVKGMFQKTELDVSLGRHGGDLQGIINRLDYLQDLGITAIWINPEIENNQPHESYHGYAATDFYKIDPRFGTNDLYQTLVQTCAKRGIKVIKDVVHNHIGDQHWWMKDLPTKTWIHQFDQFTKTTYRAPTLFDPYASEADKTLMSDGWFDVHMPDLNQKDPHLARYLIQNNIWWIEFAGLEGLRIDTYAYPDKNFTAAWGRAILDEYPKIGIFGETWVHGVVTQSFFTDNNGLKTEHRTNLPAVTDFQLYYAINEALTKEQGWTDGVARIYYTLAKDIAYADPSKNVIFLDNHDVTRFGTVVGENIEKIKSGLAFLLTTRGIPMLYYGTEIAMTGDGLPDHGYLRKNFPGGFPNDKLDKFSPEGRTDTENEIFNFTRSLIQYRNSSEVLQNGKLMQFVPTNGIYTYFRYLPDHSKAVMVVMNTNEKTENVATTRFSEQLNHHKTGKNILNGEPISDLSKPLALKPFETLVIELQ